MRRRVARAADALWAGAGGALVLDLTRPPGRAPDGPAAAAAREGTQLTVAAAPFARAVPPAPRPAPVRAIAVAPAPPTLDERGTVVSRQEEAAGDESWMPPASATVVEYDRPVAPRPRRPWLLPVAIGGGVAGAVCGFLACAGLVMRSQVVPAPTPVLAPAPPRSAFSPPPADMEPPGDGAG